jgi:predicted transcriptional regulator
MISVKTKHQIIKTIEDLPRDAGIEEAPDRHNLLRKVDRGPRQADNGELISQEEVRKHMAKWLK